MAEGYMVALAPCFSCKSPFMFDPDKVPSIPICQGCQMPPDMHDASCTKQFEIVKQPLCHTCVDGINANKRRRGEPLVRIIPGAYPDED